MGEQKNLRKILRMAVFAFVAYLGASLLAAIALVDDTLRVPKVVHASESPAPWLLAAARDGKAEEVAIRAHDGAMLRGWFLQPAAPGPDHSALADSHSNGARESAIVLHGLGDDRRGMSGQAELLLRHGYSVLMPDSRAHGESGGELATFGILESADTAQWVAWLENRVQPGVCVFGVGTSMGAAILLESLPRIEQEDAARSAPPPACPECTQTLQVWEGNALFTHFCAAVAEAPFASFREIAYDRIGQPFHLGPWVGKTIGRPIIELGMVYSRWRYGVDLEQASPMEAVTHTHIPVLLIAGLEDKNIPAYHSRMIHARDPQTLLWEPRGVGHGDAISVVPEEYDKRMLGLFAQSAK